MIRVICAAFALALVGAVVGAVESRADSVVRREGLMSQHLGREWPFLVYLPPGYEKSERRHPVLYLLHGAGGDENSWIELGHIKEKADRLIASGEIPSAIIVMPGCRTCWWVDGATDRAETAFWTELVPGVARRFRTIESREGRLVAGLSAGGFGAVRFALRYPDRLVAAAALSPAVYAESPPAISAARTQPPFLRPDGSFDQAAWTAKNYPSLTGWYFDQQHRVSMYLASGDNDRFGIAFETALLFKRLFDRQPEATELRIVDGDHSWTVWENAIDGAMRYIFRFAARPLPIVPGSFATVPIAVARR